ncbi:lipopolysaccharide biosynthesis protein [Phocaeicola oris]|uniref:lipopolysaccharide biosynthesis protein n=1 Tax=Phocaeicola oris TaxID=2896850 RepID=UPI00234E435D|nr:lipopolysaccharide biosynthesis protein [Phocaeicola oris]MCE2617243.1 lipopolysaccharide biosynthesis protein [Phocaeicola oris]
MYKQSLKEKTAKGLLWGGLNNGFQQLLGLIFGIILGRLLSPREYGMIGMISIFALIANALQSSGFKNAIANLKEPKHEDYNSVFWFNIIVGTSCYIILFFCAPLIAMFYHNDELIPLCRYAFLSIIFSSLGTAQSAYLFRNLKVKQQAIAGMTAVIISNIIGVTMAWKGYSYWSLATQSLVYISLNSLLLWYYSPWRPTLQINFIPVKRMFKFSSKILGTTILTHINNNILSVLLGRHFTPKEVGNYNQAYIWDSKCYYLIQGMVDQVAQPVFTTVSNEQERQLNILRKLVRFTSFISFPLLLGLALISREFIVLAITEKWLTCAGYLQILCISGAFMPFYTIFSNLIISKGKSGTYLMLTLAFCVLQIVLMLMLYPYGILSMIIAYVILNICWVFVNHHFVRSYTGYRFMLFLKDILPFFLIALGVMTITYALTSTITNLIVLLITRIIIATILYITIMRLAKAEILNECIQFIFRRRRHE